MSETTDEPTPETTPEATAETTPETTPETVDEPTPEPLEADGTPVDHGPLERAEEAIEEARSASADVERTGGTFGGDVIEDPDGED